MNKITNKRLLKKTVLGAICGDICGSTYEFDFRHNSEIHFIREGSDFTDDSVMTLAVLKSLKQKDWRTENWTNDVLIPNMVDLGTKYTHRGYGGMFIQWLNDENRQPYNSFGNGSAMRTSPVPFFCNDREEVLKLSEIVASVTHNHEEGIKGAQAVSIAIWDAIHGMTPKEIKKDIEGTFGYDLSRRYDKIKETYHFEASCQKSVPESIICSLISRSTIGVLYKAIGLRGDADTMACISMSIAVNLTSVKQNFNLNRAYKYLTPDLKDIIDKD